MTGTLISLISILTGIIAANVFGFLFKKYTFGLTGNSLIGVFGSVLFIKSFGKLGFSPWAIMNHGNINGSLLTINILVSALGSIILLIFSKVMFHRMNN